MDNKLPRVLQPSLRLYFLLLVAFALSTFLLGDYYRILAVVQMVLLIILAVYSSISAKNRTAQLLDYLESISDGMDLTIRDTPLPVLVYNSRTNEIIWSNDRFSSIAGISKPFIEKSITDIVPQFDTDWILEGKGVCPSPISVGEQLFRVYGGMVQSEREYIATTYWVDVTEYEHVSNEYEKSRPVMLILLIDNYEDIHKGVSEKEKSILSSNIDDKIVTWAGEVGGYLCRYDRDKYFFIFEERFIDGFVEDNFSILEAVRSEIGADGIPASISIGVGKDGSTMHETFRFATLGVEMALSRGGDQAVIKNRFGFEFFGGHSMQAEKSTKVKSRIMASAFGELLSDASAVFVMGHKLGDFDAIGAAAGICCIARIKKIPAKIVIDFEHNAAQPLISLLAQLPEYRDVFISEKDALIQADNKSLLAVVDTSRPDRVESESLLLSCTRIAVIDHHRRAADYISNAVLNYHEATASSASELVTEMLQYLVENKDILPGEALALLSGIVLDTKGFSVNTGGSTFDAAAFLRRVGADLAFVKQLMQTDIAVASERYEILRSVVIYTEGVAIASSHKVLNRTSVAQAADELLNIAGVHTTFAIASEGNGAVVSARSSNGFNVQVIMEKLGGGGSSSNAGVQLPNLSAEQAVSMVERAIDEYSIEEEEQRYAAERLRVEAER